MSVNTLILNSIHGSCATGCGCALCIPNTINELESPQLIIDDRLHVIDDTQDGLNQIAVVDELLRNTTALEALWHSLEYNPNVDPVLLNVATNALQGPYTRLIRLPSVESFTNDPDMAMQVSMESIGDMLATAWEAIKNFIVNLYQKVTAFFRKLFGINERIIKKGEHNAKEVIRVEHEVKQAEVKEAPKASPITSISVSSTSAKYLSMMSNKHASIAEDLAVQVGRYHHFYSNGFKPYVSLQRFTCEQILKNNQLLIKSAEDELAKGAKRDDILAKNLISKAKKRAGEQQGPYNVAIDAIRNKTAGNYIGGLFVNNSPNAKENAEIFDFRTVDTNEQSIPLLTLEQVNHLNDNALSLAKDHQAVMEGEFGQLEDLTKNILEAAGNMVKVLKSDYSDYPALIRAFNTNSNELQSHYNTLLSRLYRVVKHTSELTTVILNDVVPAMLSAHEHNAR